MSTADSFPPAPATTGRPHPTSPPPESTVILDEGWHVGHYFYRFRRDALSGPLPPQVQEQFLAALSPTGDAATQRLAAYWISGHECDFGVMIMDPHPAKVDRIHQNLIAPPLGQFVQPVWSFVSVSEVSEYVPTVEQFRERLIREGVAPDSDDLASRVSVYERRLPMMNRGRLYPEFPEWPAACFYPMNKSRVPGANWFEEPFSARADMMSEHAKSGIAFAGKVTQLISVGVGLDDWEWMVTLWGRNPQYLKDIVYRMRFDKASAKYAQFGPFYVGYRASAAEILQHCRMT